MAVTIPMEGAGEISSTLYDNLPCLALIEAVGEMSLSGRLGVAINVALEADGEVTSINLPAFRAVLPTESTVEISSRLLSDRIIKTIFEGEGWATEHTPFSGLCVVVTEGEGVGPGETLSSLKYFISQVPLDSVGEMPGQSLVGFVSSIETEGEVDIASLSTYGYTSAPLLEGELEVSGQSLVGFYSNKQTESAYEVSSSVLCEFSVTLPSVGEGDNTGKVLTWSIVKVVTPGEAEVLPGVYQAVLDSLALALYGKNAEATTFSNFNFNSYVELDGVTYAVTDDGLYSLSGTSDNSTTIVPRVTVNLNRFEINKVKQLRSIFTDSSSKVAVTLDGVEKSYTASTGGKVECKYSHKGKNLSITFSEFESLRDIEIFFYLLARRR